MITKFINREKELAFLEKKYKEQRSGFLVIYGRRRVGKTELLNQFAKKHRALYLVARQESKKDQLKKHHG